MFGAFEEELRDLAQNPSQILAPTFSLAFLAQRLLSVLFWFVVTLAVATIAPGAVSRSVARFHLSTLKVVAIGFVGFILTTISVIVGLRFLRDTWADGACAVDACVRVRTRCASGDYR
jgi:hypothetical protein